MKTCIICKNKFKAKRVDAKMCSSTCRSKKRRTILKGSLAITSTCQ